MYRKRAQDHLTIIGGDTAFPKRGGQGFAEGVKILVVLGSSRGLPDREHALAEDVLRRCRVGDNSRKQEIAWALKRCLDSVDEITVKQDGRDRHNTLDAVGLAFLLG